MALPLFMAPKDRPGWPLADDMTAGESQQGGNCPSPTTPVTAEACGKRKRAGVLALIQSLG